METRGPIRFRHPRCLLISPTSCPRPPCQGSPGQPTHADMGTLRRLHVHTACAEAGFTATPQPKAVSSRTHFRAREHRSTTRNSSTGARPCSWAAGGHLRFPGFHVGLCPPAGGLHVEALRASRTLSDRNRQQTTQTGLTAVLCRQVCRKPSLEGRPSSPRAHLGPGGGSQARRLHSPGPST